MQTTRYFQKSSRNRSREREPGAGDTHVCQRLQQSRLKRRLTHVCQRVSATAIIPIETALSDARPRLAEVLQFQELQKKICKDREKKSVCGNFCALAMGFVESAQSSNPPKLETGNPIPIPPNERQARSKGARAAVCGEAESVSVADVT